MAISKSKRSVSKHQRQSQKLSFLSNRSLTMRKRKYLKSRSSRFVQEEVGQRTHCKDFLKTKEFILEFREFLVREVSDENLDFYMEVEAYKKMKPMKQAKTAIIIYNKYLKVDADREVNVTAGARRETVKRMNHPCTSTFDVAQEHVFKVMEMDSFPRFLASKRKTVVETMNGNKKDSQVSVDFSMTFCKPSLTTFMKFKRS